MIYIDDMYAPFGRMKMCHMIADTPAELRNFAERLGLRMRWIQNRGTHKEHFDVSVGVREAAVQAGAREISQRDLAAMVSARCEVYPPAVQA